MSKAIKLTQYAVFVGDSKSGIRSIGLDTNVHLDRLSQADLKSYLGDRLYIGEGETVHSYQIGVNYRLHGRSGSTAATPSHHLL